MAPGLSNVRLSLVIILVAAIITLLFLPLTSSINNYNTLLQSQLVFVQAQEEEEVVEELVDFLPYDNPEQGIYIEYPSNWLASASGMEDYTTLIAFYSPLQGLSDLSNARLKISVVPYQNITLSEYTNLILAIMNQSQQQVDVKNSSEVTLAGYPGFRIIYEDKPLQNNTQVLYHMNTWTTIGNKVYVLAYEGEQTAFNRHLAEVDRMLQSFEIII